VPWISIRAGRDDSWRDITDPTLAHVNVFDVHATWHFDRLVFDPNEIRITAIDVSRRRERRHVAALVIQTYFDWLAVRAAAIQAPRLIMRAAELAADLDAITDGWFSQAIAKVL
jgi:hypothetical protein